MGTYHYTGRDRTSGQQMDGRLEAPSQTAAVSILRDRGMLITSIKEVAPRGTAKKQKRGRKRKITLDDLVIFSRQMATMVNAGLPLIEGLSVLSEQMENASFRAVIRQIEQDVESGEQLFEAMAKHPKVFNELYVNLIRAGEASGMLDQILMQLATYLEKAAALARKVKAAAIYPSIIITVALGVVTLLLMKVVPVFSEIFTSFDAELPYATRLLVSASYALRDNALYIFPTIAILGFLLTRYIKTPSGRYQFDALMLKAPVVGPLMRKVAVAKFTRTFATLLRAGVNILISLEIVAKTAGNKIVEQAIDQTREAIREGESIATPLKDSGVFPPMVVRMIDIGERAGALDSMLQKIADFYEEQVETAVEGLTSLMEPLIICFLGVVVGGIVIAMFLPMFNLGSVVFKS